MARKKERGTVLSHEQNCLIARFVINELDQRPWFRGTVQPLPDRLMTLMLFRVYLAMKEGSPLHKKAIWAGVGSPDPKTGRKHLHLAEQMGLVEVRPSPIDKRKEVARLTAHGEALVVVEIYNLIVALLALFQQLLENEDKSLPLLTEAIRSFSQKFSISKNKRARQKTASG